MQTGIKHLIECHCMLPQYRSAPKPVFHKFIVFSIIDENDSVMVKYVRCPNCGMIHRVTEIGKSELLIDKDKFSAIITIEDIKKSLPKPAVDVLEEYDCDIATWEECQFVVENSMWDKSIVIEKTYDSSEIHTKMMTLTNGGLGVKLSTRSTKV